MVNEVLVNYDYETTTDYLTEEGLGNFLKNFLPTSEIIHDKIVPNSNIKNRPDYRIENLKLIFEFNGHYHYTNPNSILNDYKKKEVYEKMGYTIHNIPYWIQLRSDIIYYLFNNKIPNLDGTRLKDYTTFPLGFISPKCVLPSSFCVLGTIELSKEQEKWNGIIDKYYKYFDYTLIDKILEKDSFFTVVNERILPYFRELWKNKGHGFGLTIDITKYPGITKELEIF